MYYMPMNVDSSAKNLHTTLETLKKIGSKAMEVYPTAHNRKRYEARQRAIIEYCMKKATPISGYKVGDVIAYIENVNLGTTKYAEIVPTVYFDTIVKIGPKSVSTQVRKMIPYNKILGKVTVRKTVSKKSRTNTAGIPYNALEIKRLG